MTSPTHRLFAFTEATYREAFSRGYEDARYGRPAPGEVAHTVDFVVDAGGGARRGSLSFTMLPPLAEARYDGWRMGEAGARTADAVAAAAGEGLSRWRARPSLRFVVEEREEPPFGAAELALWSALSCELTAEGLAPTPPEEPLSFAAEGAGEVGERAASRTRDLRFAVALTPEITSVTLTVGLGGEERALVFALP